MTTITAHCYVDWDNSGAFGDFTAGTGEDVSAYLLGYDISRGRTEATADYGEGQCTLLLKNETGLFSKHNQSSSLFGLLRPGPAVKVMINVNSTGEVARFFGYITDIEETRTPAGQPAVRVTAADGFRTLALIDVDVEMAAGRSVDEFIDAILDAAGWPASLRSLDGSDVTLDYSWAFREKALSALKRAAASEMGGRLHMDYDGSVRFESRMGFSTGLLTTLTGPEAIAIGTHDRDLVDSVRHSYGGLSADAESKVRFVLNGPVRLKPGVNTVFVPIDSQDGAVAWGGSASLTYVANSNMNGSGTDRTSDVTVTDSAYYGGVLAVEFTNAHTARVFLLPGMSVSDSAIIRQTDDRTIEAQTASPIVVGNVLASDFEWVNDDEVVEAFAEFRAIVHGMDQDIIPITITAKNDALANFILSSDLGVRVGLEQTTGLYPTDVEGEFYIEHIAETFRPGPLLQAQWTLFATDLVYADLWSVSDTGSEDGSFVPAATRANGSQSLPTATINVDSTTNFPSSGVLLVSGRPAIAYSGKTSTTFTGCVGGTGTLADNARLVQAGGDRIRWD